MMHNINHRDTEALRFFLKKLFSASLCLCGEKVLIYAA